jgi:FKBP-type peptidyl-prolyl cis-trans isomerase
MMFFQFDSRIVLEAFLTRAYLADSTYTMEAKMRKVVPIALLARALVVGCGKKDKPKDNGEASMEPEESAKAALEKIRDGKIPDFKSLNLIEIEDGVKYIDLKEGTGGAIGDGETAVVQYSGWLTNGRQVDSSRPRNRPISFVIGGEGIIQGWQIGVKGMKVGTERLLYIPSKYGYGAAGRGPVPPNADLVFEIELVSIQ